MRLSGKSWSVKSAVGLTLPHDPVEQRSDGIPRLGKHFPVATTQRRRVLCSDQHPLRVVVQQRVVRAPSRWPSDSRSPGRSARRFSAIAATAPAGRAQSLTSRPRACVRPSRRLRRAPTRSVASCCDPSRVRRPEYRRRSTFSQANRGWSLQSRVRRVRAHRPRRTANVGTWRGVPAGTSTRPSWQAFKQGISEVVSDRLVLITSPPHAAQFVLNGMLNAFLPLYGRDVLNLSGSGLW